MVCVGPRRWQAPCLNRCMAIVLKFGSEEIALLVRAGNGGHNGHTGGAALLPEREASARQRLLANPNLPAYSAAHGFASCYHSECVGSRHGQAFAVVSVICFERPMLLPAQVLDRFRAFFQRYACLTAAQVHIRFGSIALFWPGRQILARQTRSGSTNCLVRFLARSCNRSWRRWPTPRPCCDAVGTTCFAPYCVCVSELQR